MKLLPKDQAIFRENNEVCAVTEYKMGDPDIDFAIVTLSGRYPEEGRVLNTRSKEMVYISEGNGTIEVEGKSYPLKAGDAVLIDVGEKFCWEGNMTLFISCHPAFTLEQHQHIA